MVSLCGKRKCCPQMVREKEFYVITDDYGGTVKLTEEELNCIEKAKKVLDDEQNADF